MSKGFIKNTTCKTAHLPNPSTQIPPNRNDYTKMEDEKTQSQ